MNSTPDPQHCRCHDTAPLTRTLADRLIRRSEDALDHAQTAAAHARTVRWQGAAAEHCRDTLDAAHRSAAAIRDGLPNTRRLAWG